MYSSLVLCVLCILSVTSAANANLHRHIRSALPTPPRVALFPPSASAPLSLPPSASTVGWSIDTSRRVNAVGQDLWGIFFEEINHAGQGGLYSQQVQNTNFESATADYAPWAELKAQGLHYTIQLSVERPLNPYNPTALKVTTAGAAGSAVGVVNPGYWGINLINRTAFDLRLWVQSATVTALTAAITSADGSATYGAVNLTVTDSWAAQTGRISVSSSDPNAHLQLTWTQSASAASTVVWLDVVTLQPTAGWRGLPYIREDLAEVIAAMQPSFVRFPGGCYVEGDRLANRFNWKRAIGPLEQRTGHYNLWGYYSEDGLGPFEYFSWVERLRDAYGQPTRSIWVINNGVAHDDSIPNADISGYVQDALDSVQFITGPPDSEWGSVRARMGRSAPFELQYVAIGNEDCGKPYYLDNYKSFYTALSAAHPNITLISNCGPDGSTPVTLWDYHVYQSSLDFINQQTIFDKWDRTSGATIFNSEFANSVRPECLTQYAALGEACWMTGLERNADIITMASYAPLLSNADAVETFFDAIIFNHYQLYLTPSYWNQQMFASSFSDLQPGSVYTLASKLSGAVNVSVSITVGSLQSSARSRYGGANTVFVMKIVNVNAQPTSLSISLAGLPSSAQLLPTVDAVVLSASDLYAQNTFDNPNLVAAIPFQVSVNWTANPGQLDTCVNLWSITTARIYAIL